MTQNFDNVTISRREYDELNRKAFAFDTYKRKVKEDKYLTDIEKILFLDDEPKGIPAEEWAKIEALMEEQEEENAETV